MNVQNCARDGRIQERREEFRKTKIATHLHRQRGAFWSDSGTDIFAASLLIRF